MKRSALRRKTRIRSHKPLKASRLQLRRRPRPKLVDSTIWRRDLGACIVCPAEGGICSGPVQGHHAVAKAKLRQLGLTAAAMDLRNRVPVCERRHAQHTTGYRPIPRELLPASVFVFAADLDLGWYLDKHYPAAALPLEAA